MKKLLTLAALVAASTMQAASINWSIGGNTTTVVKDYSNNAYASQTAYLILGSDLSSITYNDENKLSESDFTSALESLTLASAVSSATGSKPSVSGQTVTSSDMTAGTRTTFGLLIVSKNDAGEGFYKVLTASGTPYADGATPDAQTTLTTAWAGLNNQAWVQGWGISQEPDPGPGPTPGVPEPATGALALAGVALLFKRRRA